MGTTASERVHPECGHPLFVCACCKQEFCAEDASGVDDGQCVLCSSGLAHPYGKVRPSSGGKFTVDGHPRHVGPHEGHLSECMVVAHPDDGHCTCDDSSPE